jgi:hypothetical protein
MRLWVVWGGLGWFRVGLSGHDLPIWRVVVTTGGENMVGQGSGARLRHCASPQRT